jgi:hypothetical protein
MPPPSGHDGAPVDRWDDMLVEAREVSAEAREMLPLLRSVGDDAEARRLEGEIDELEHNLTRLLEARRSEAPLHAGDRAGLPDWPTGHFAWVFSGRAQFEQGTRSFLAQGAERDEQLVVIAADDPDRCYWSRVLVDGRHILVCGIAEVLGREGVVLAAALRTALATAVREARAAGYSGVRVVTDNTSFLDTAERFDAWIEADRLGDRLMTGHPLTVMCAFDRLGLSSEILEAATALHDIVV